MDLKLPPPLLEAPVSKPSLMRRVLRRFDLKFAFFVLIPTLLAGLYYGVIASDVYISESRFVVRNPQRPAMSGLGSILQGTLLSRSQDDTYFVHDYMRSRDALATLQQQLGLRNVFGAETIDPFNRFPGVLGSDSTFESFFKYYENRVSIVYDSVSSISVLQVRAYTADDARKINERLLEMGERLLNNMNLRSRQDLIQVAEQEVKVAEERAKKAATSLASFRSDSSIFEPTVQGQIQIQGVSRMREDLIAAEAQLTELKRISPQNPQIASLEARVASLRRSMGEESDRVLGRRGSLASKSPEYDRLLLEKAFADRQLATALGTLDGARAESARKQLYLERLVDPSLPDKALEPRRLRGVITVFVVGLIVWGIMALIVAAVREHQS